MNWDMAIKLAEMEATKYADKSIGFPKGSDVWCERYNGYYSGYMQNAAERESFRAIVKRLEGKSHYTSPVEEIAGLDDLV